MTELYSVPSTNSRAAGANYVERQPRSRYRKYEWYYKNPEELFKNLRFDKDLRNLTRAEVFNADNILTSLPKSLRNPIHRVVEFYATTMLSGTAKEAFPLREVEDGVRDAILKLWAFSNLDNLKQRVKRLVAMHGIVFVKVAYEPEEQRVSFQEIKAEHVSDYSRDARGHIDYIRLDIPVEPTLEEEADPAKALEKKTVTEIWRKGRKTTDKYGNVTGKEPGYFRTWTRDRDPSENAVLAEDKLDNPDVTWLLSEQDGPNSLGFDFVPFVDIVAADTAEKFPCPIYEHALPLITETAKKATRYSELLFLYNKPHRAVEGIGNDPSGRPYPAPEVPGTDGPVVPDQDTVMFMNRMATLLQQVKPDETLGGDIWYGAPGNARISDITPNIDFEAQRRAIDDDLAELTRELPELVYYDADASAIPDSSRAVRLMMRGAIERTREMRSNIETALIKADKMGLTMAQLKDIEGFSEAEIGTYENGEGFEHSFEETEVVETSDIEKEEVRGRRIANMIALIQLGFTREQAAEEVGLTHLKFPENAPENPGMDPEQMSVGTGGNPAGGTNLENAAARVERGFTNTPL